MYGLTTQKTLSITAARCTLCFLAPVIGVLIGQAVTLHEWEFPDGTRGGPIAEANAVDVRQTKAASEDIAQAGQF